MNPVDYYHDINQLAYKLKIVDRYKKNELTYENECLLYEKYDEIHSDEVDLIEDVVDGVEFIVLSMKFAEVRVPKTNTIISVFKELNLFIDRNCTQLKKAKCISDTMDILVKARFFKKEYNCIDYFAVKIFNIDFNYKYSEHKYCRKISNATLNELISKKEELIKNIPNDLSNKNFDELYNIKVEYEHLSILCKMISKKISEMTNLLIDDN